MNAVLHDFSTRHVYVVINRHQEFIFVRVLINILLVRSGLLTVCVA